MKKHMAAIAAAAVGCLFCLNVIRAQALQQGISEKILRFHVLANSDSSEDQELKLKVRDEVGNYMAVQLADVSSLEESEEVVSDHLSDIEQLAESVVREEGYDYPVTASLENSMFPEKTYGEYTFPSGYYEALRVVIGEGEGQNWWCVMYPNLCFSGSMYETDEETGEKLNAELTKEEYAAVLENGDYDVSFKILKFMNRLLE